VTRPGRIRFLSWTAPFYDPTVSAFGFSRLWKRLAERTLPEAGVRCLDVCTGTGGAALALAGRGASVVGLDLAEGMLRRARRKARAAGLAERAHWVRMDARRLALPDRSFEHVTCAMVFHEMDDEEREQVIREMHRVASDRVLIADYRVPPSGWSRPLFHFMRVFEYLESDDFDSYRTDDLPARLEKAGLDLEETWDVGPYRIWPCRVQTQHKHC
jgi:ubiquinone/menaquinone biosynthesis C-methylase UbiE